ncbi:hypothetical protein LIR51_13790 [Blautia producta]|nr:hypothetical protein [Blautia producta]MCB5875889.1 hypothetical protein [Blautia producta]
MRKCLCYQKRCGQHGKMSVAKREMWSEWESVCVAKERCGQNGKVSVLPIDVVRMGKLAVRRKECSIKINVSVEGKGCGMGLGMYRNIGSVLECGYE